MLHSFNLVTENWIPCINRSGDIVELSLLDVLVKAHQLQEIFDESPLVTASLHRLLLAVLHRVFGPANKRGWYTLWEKTEWPEEPLRAYLAQWEHRFDLFDPDYPFYQKFDERLAEKSPWESFCLVHSSKNNPALFKHQSINSYRALSPAEAARGLVATQAFRTGGLGPIGSFVDGPCARGIVFLVQGDNLFETLALKLFRYPIPDNIMLCDANDKPFWEMDDPFSARTVPLGYLDYLTWPMNSVKLNPEFSIDGSLEVKTFYIAPAMRLDGAVYNPHYWYTKSTKGPREKRFQEDSTLWRDSASLLSTAINRTGYEGQAPYVLSWLAGLVDDGYLDSAQTYQLMALGMATNRDKVIFYRQERLPLPLAYLKNHALVEQLDDALVYAGRVYSSKVASVANPKKKYSGGLNAALWKLAQLILSPQADQEGGREPDPADIKKLQQHWGTARMYWGALEEPFWRLVADLPAQDEAALYVWYEALRKAAEESLEHAVQMAGAGPVVMKAAVRARRSLFSSLQQILPVKEKEELDVK